MQSNKEVWILNLIMTEQRSKRLNEKVIFYFASFGLHISEHTYQYCIALMFSDEIQLLYIIQTCFFLS